jgi:hypothetical protein
MRSDLSSVAGQVDAVCPWYDMVEAWSEAEVENV